MEDVSLDSAPSTAQGRAPVGDREPEEQTVISTGGQLILLLGLRGNDCYFFRESVYQS